MKDFYKNIICLLLGLCPLALSAQWVPSTCAAPDSTVLAAYEFDAAKLALRRIYETKSQDTAKVNIPLAVRDSVMRVLLAVHNALELEAREDVIDFYDIHAFADPNVHSFLLTLDTTFDWTKNLLNSGLSGEPIIDALIEQYQLDLTSHTYTQNNHALLRLKTDQAINSRALAYQFSNFKGVINWQEDLVLGESSRDITYSVHEGYAELIFRYSWGDCESGCIYDHFWRFHIDENCSVRFEDDFGTPLTTQDLGDIVGINVYPNPTTDLIQVKLLGPNKKGLEMQLYNATGQLLQSFEMNSGTGLLSANLSLYGLPVGVYFIAFRNEASVLTEKVLKR